MTARRRQRRPTGERRAWQRGGGEGPGPGGPLPREMYRVATGCLSKIDAHPDDMRPVVVLRVNEETRTVSVCTRTSQREDGSGVKHDANLELDLDKTGWFRSKWFQHVQRHEFVHPLVRRLGWLDEKTYEKVEEEVA